jgi:hypothetical protein
MKLTKNMIDHVRSSLAARPLAPQELRRVEGMGDLYVSSSRLAVDDEGKYRADGMVYWEMYSLRVDGEVRYFYRGIEEGVCE